MVEQEAPKKMKQYLKFTDFDQVNEFAELGYKLHSLTFENKIFTDGPSVNIPHYIMYLDKGSYEDVTNLADVSPSDVDQYLANGWEIASTSISTKFVRMIKRATA